MNQRLTTIEAGRGIAALLVVAFHAAGFVHARPHTFPYWFRFGASGVDFFFVLSGFIIYYIHHGDIGQRHKLAPYVRKRLLRIFPTYLSVMAVLIPIVLLAPSAAQHDKSGFFYFACSLLLLPQSREPVLGVSWSLTYELLFYTLFGLVILHRRIGFIIAGLYVAFFAAGQWVTLSFPLNFFTYTRSAEFLLGVFGAYVWRYLSVPVAWLLTVLGIAGFVTVGHCHWPVLLYLPLPYGVFASIAIAGLVKLENQGHVRAGKVWVFLGAASYSIYLVHYPVVALIDKLAGHFRSVPATAVWWVMVIFGAGTGALFHLAYERHLLRFLNRRFGSSAVKDGVAPYLSNERNLKSALVGTDTDP